MLSCGTNSKSMSINLANQSDTFHLSSDSVCFQFNCSLEILLLARKHVNLTLCRVKMLVVSIFGIP